LTEAYDNCNNLVTKTDRLGVVTTNAYDALNRLISVTAKKNGTTAVSEYMLYAYYKTGAKKQETNENLSTSFIYDDAGRLTQQTETTNTVTVVNGEKLPSLVVVKSQTYDVRDNRGSFTLTRNGTQLLYEIYGYDSMNRLTSVYENGVTQATYKYDLNGNRQSVAYANGVTTTYAYNSANLVTSINNLNGSTVLSSYTYAYRLDGNQVSKTAAGGISTQYTYATDIIGLN